MERKKLLVYDSTLRDGTQGEGISFSIDDKIKVVKTLDPYCDKEAIRVIMSMPKWIPGKQNGKAVSVKYTVPIVFRLQ